MNFKKYTFTAFAAACALLTASCSAALGTTPSSVPLQSGTSYAVIGNAQGTSTTFSLLFFPFGSSTPMRDALASALESKNADGLIEVQADYYVFNFLYLFGTYTTEVRGKAIKFQKDTGK